MMNNYMILKIRELFENNIYKPIFGFDSNRREYRHLKKIK